MFSSVKELNMIWVLFASCIGQRSQLVTETCLGEFTEITEGASASTSCFSNTREYSEGMWKQSTSERWFFCPWHRQPSLVAFAPTSLLWLSGKASGLVTRRSWVRLQLGAFGFFRLFYWQKNHLSHVFTWFKIHRHISITVHKHISTFSPSSTCLGG